MVTDERSSFWAGAHLVGLASVEDKGRHPQVLASGRCACLRSWVRLLLLPSRWRPCWRRRRLGRDCSLHKPQNLFEARLCRHLRGFLKCMCGLSTCTCGPRGGTREIEVFCESTIRPHSFTFQLHTLFISVQSEAPMQAGWRYVQG